MENLPFVNMTHLLNNDRYKLSFTPDDKENELDANLRRFKDKLLFISTLVAMVVLLATCISFLFVKPDSNYTGIALNGVIGLVMALIGYYVRGK